MTLFEPLYDKAYRLSQHPNAKAWLGFFSFSDSIFNPIPPDVLLLPMCFSQPAQAYRLAMWTLAFSIAGAILGYAIGYWAWAWVEPVVLDIGYGDKVDTVQHWFDAYGLWMVLLAGFTPVPYKIFTLSSGAMGVAFWPFLWLSVLSRGLRFLLVAFLAQQLSRRYEQQIKQSIEWLGWLLVLLVGLLIAWKMATA